MTKKLRTLVYSLLRQTERYIKTDMIYLTKGGFWLTFGQIMSTLASFGLSVAFANLLPSIIYGKYQFVLAVAGILSATTLSGLNTAAIRSVARGAEGVILTSLKAKLRWGSVGSFAALCIAGYYFIQSNNILAISFLIIALFLPLFYSLGISNSLLKGKKLFRINIYYGTISQITVVLIMIALLFLSDNILLVLATYFATWTFAKFIVFHLTIRRYQTNNLLDPELSSYGKHLSLMGVIGTIADYLDKLLIFHFLGAVQVAVYSFAVAPVMQINGALKNIHTLALPKLSQRSKFEIQKTIIGRNLLILFLSAPFSALYIVAAPYIYRIFFPAYLESVIFSQVFALSILLTAFGTLSATALEAQMEVKRKYILTSFSKISKIVLMLALVIPYGLWGIIIGILINYTLVVFLALWLVKKT